MSKAAWKIDGGQAQSHFKYIVWPEIKQWFGDTPKLSTTENQETSLNKDFDRIAGIDYWISDDDMWSIASRVQTQEHQGFASHTIRYSRASGVDTEHQKRVRQYRNDSDLPTYTVQAYVNEHEDAIRNAAMCKTRALYQYITENILDEYGEVPEHRILSVKDEPQTFYPVWWGELDEALDLTVLDRQRAGLINNNQTSINDWTENGGDDA